MWLPFFIFVFAGKSLIRDRLMELTNKEPIAGILLAAGRGARFDPTGAENKLGQILPNGDTVVAAAAKNLLAVLPTVIAVVRPGADALASRLRTLGCRVIVCPDAAQGMGVSLAYALSQAHDASGWVIALADMPYVQVATIAALANALAAGADIAAPHHQGRRGNPVAFSRLHLQRLLQLTGDQGARNLLREFPVTEIEVDDPGIFHDIDHRDDLARTV